MSALQFLNKKSWHTSTIRNNEKVWLREQEAAKENARIAELQKQLAEEQRQEELERLEEESGRIDPNTALKRRRLNWMYEYGRENTSEEARSHEEKEREDVMLGKKPISLDELGEKQREERATLVDEEAKMREDPLIQIEMQEAKTRALFGTNRGLKHNNEEQDKARQKAERKEERRRIREERKRKREQRHAKNCKKLEATSATHSDEADELVRQYKQILPKTRHDPFPDRKTVSRVDEQRASRQESCRKQYERLNDDLSFAESDDVRHEIRGCDSPQPECWVSTQREGRRTSSPGQHKSSRPRSRLRDDKRHSYQQRCERRGDRNYRSFGDGTSSDLNDRKTLNSQYERRKKRDYHDDVSSEGYGSDRYHDSYKR